MSSSTATSTVATMSVAPPPKRQQQQQPASSSSLPKPASAPRPYFPKNKRRSLNSSKSLPKNLNRRSSLTTTTSSNSNSKSKKTSTGTGRKALRKSKSMCTYGPREQQQTSDNGSKRRSLLADYALERAAATQGKSPRSSAIIRLDQQQQPSSSSGRRSRRSSHSETLQSLYKFGDGDNRDDKRSSDPAEELEKALSTTEILLNLPMDGSGYSTSSSSVGGRRRTNRYVDSAGMDGSQSSTYSNKNNRSCSSRLRMSLQNVLAQDETTTEDDKNRIASATQGLGSDDAAATSPLRRCATANQASTQGTMGFKRSSTVDSISSTSTAADTAKGGIQFELRRSGTATVTPRRGLTRQLSSTSRLRKSISDLLNLESSPDDPLSLLLGPTSVHSAPLSKQQQQKNHKRQSDSDLLSKGTTNHTAPLPATKSLNELGSASLSSSKQRYSRRARLSEQDKVPALPPTEHHPSGVAAIQVPNKALPNPEEILDIFKPRASLFRTASTEAVSSSKTKLSLLEQTSKRSSMGCQLIPLHKSRRMSTNVNNKRLSMSLRAELESNLKRQDSRDPALPLPQQLQIQPDASAEEDFDDDLSQASSAAYPKRSWMDSSTSVTPSVEELGYGDEAQQKGQEHEQEDGKKTKPRVELQRQLTPLVTTRASASAGGAITYPSVITAVVSNKTRAGSMPSHSPMRSRRGSTMRLSGPMLGETPLALPRSSGHGSGGATKTNSNNVPPNRRSSIRCLQTAMSDAAGKRGSANGARSLTTPARLLSGLSLSEMALSTAQQQFSSASTHGNAQWTSSQAKQENPFLKRHSVLGRSKTGPALKRGGSSLGSSSHHRQSGRIVNLTKEEEKTRGSLGRKGSFGRRSSLKLSGLSYSEMALSNAQHEMSSSSLSSSSSHQQLKQRSESSSSGRRSCDESLESSSSSISLQGNSNSFLKKRLNVAQKSLLDNSLFDDSLLNDSILDDSTLGDTTLDSTSNHSCIDNRRRDKSAPKDLPSLLDPLGNNNNNKNNTATGGYNPYGGSLLDHLGCPPPKQKQPSAATSSRAPTKSLSPKPTKKNSIAIKQFIEEKKRGVSRKSSNGSLELLALLSRSGA